jgi:hypothetical protein
MSTTPEPGASLSLKTTARLRGPAPTETPTPQASAVSHQSIAVLYSDLDGADVSKFASEASRRRPGHESCLRALAVQWARDAGREIHVGDGGEYLAVLREGAEGALVPDPRGPRRHHHGGGADVDAIRQYEREVEELAQKGLIKADFFAEIVTSGEEALVPEHFVAFSDESLMFALHRTPGFSPDYCDRGWDAPEEELPFEMRIAELIREGGVGRTGVVIAGDLLVAA